MLRDVYNLWVEEIARQWRQAVHFHSEAAGKGVQEALGDPSPAIGPAPHSLLVFMKTFAERGMGGRYLDAQVIIAQHEPLNADAEASPVVRPQLQLRGDAAALGEAYLMRRRIELERVAAVDRSRRDGCSIDDQMEVRVGRSRMAERHSALK
jgi:hypothetical protein